MKKKNMTPEEWVEAFYKALIKSGTRIPVRFQVEELVEKAMAQETLRLREVYVGKRCIQQIEYDAEPCLKSDPHPCSVCELINARQEVLRLKQVLVRIGTYRRGKFHAHEENAAEKEMKQIAKEAVMDRAVRQEPK